MASRCKPSILEDCLSDIIEDAKTAYERAQAAVAKAKAEGDAARHKAAEKARRERQRGEAVARQATEDQRAAHAASVTKIMNGLPVSRRYAQMLLKDGTCSRGTAGRMAQILGTDPDNYLRRRGRTGRQADLVRWVMSLRFDGGTFRDFIESDDAPASDVVRQFRRRYARGAAVPDHFKFQDELIACVQSLRGDVESALAVWRAFTLWRIDVFAAVATASIHDMEGEYEFG